jgi:acetoin utilization protein AcuC
MSGLNLHAGEALARYGFGGGHPFGNDRFDAFWQECTARGLHQRAQIVPPVMADVATLLRFHTAEYVERVKHQSQTGAGFLDYGDTPAFAGVYEAAALVVGTTLDAVARVLHGECTRAFVPIAGLHHARRDTAAGFCVFNDIGCAIETLRAVHGVRRVGYVDIDAHHGDGVLYSFEDDPDLIFADLHEDGRYLYPGTGFADETGTGAAAGTKLNIPMPPGADDAAFLKEWSRVEEFLRAGKPEIILLQAGADSIDGDPLTHLRYTPAAHAHAAQRLRTLAEELGHGRLVALGGGGYNRVNLAKAWCVVVEALLD